MKKSLLNIFNIVVAPWPYPVLVLYHALLGSVLLWLIRGCPRVYSAEQLLNGLAASIVIGALLVLIATKLNASAAAERPE